MLIPDPRSEFLRPGSGIQGQKDCIDDTVLTKNLSIFKQNLVTKLSEIWSERFIPDLVSWFFSIPDPWLIKTIDPASGSATM